MFNKDNFLNLENDAIGIKTGFTCNAGYCFVGAIKNNGRTFVSCVLSSGWPPNKGYKWKDTIKLMDYGKDNYEFKNIIEKIEVYETGILSIFNNGLELFINY